MRRTVLLAAAALVAMVAVAVAVPSTAKAHSPWFSVDAYATVDGHDAYWEADVTNFGWMKHTAFFTVILTQQGPIDRVVAKAPLGMATLHPLASTEFHGVFTNLPRGHYACTVSAVHIFQLGDPWWLRGASTSDTYEFNVS